MDNPPGRAAPHLVADFVELMCAASIDGEWGVADLIGLRKAKDRDDATVTDLSERELILGEDDPEPDDVDVGVAAALDLPVAELERPLSEGAAESRDADESSGAAGEPSESNTEAGPAADDDARSLEGSEITEVLVYRSQRFGERWPFELYDDNNLRLRADLEPIHRFYLLLLAASCLSRFGKKDEREITTAFERLAPDALRGHLGPVVEAHIFGTSSIEGDRFSGSLWHRVRQLAKDLRIKLIAEQSEIESKSGDNGLDAVAWFPTGDESVTVVPVFVQCACGKRWRQKQQEASEGRWAPVFAFRTPVVNVTMIPYSFRRPDGRWQYDAHVERGLLLDRERILTALQNGGNELGVDEPAALADMIGHAPG